jgi:hypothetical protein
MEKIKSRWLGYGNANCVFQLKTPFNYYLHFRPEHNNISTHFTNSKLICIIYPKGQRPNLPYPQNKKEDL